MDHIPNMKTEIEPTKFLSLFVPQIGWLQGLINTKAQGISFSSYLIGLIIEDFHSRGLVTEIRYEKFLTDRKSSALRKRQTRFVAERKLRDGEDTTGARKETDKKGKVHFYKPKRHKTFSLYLQDDQKWLRRLLDTEVLRENCDIGNRSLYVWDLFVQDNQKELRVEHLQEWAKEMVEKNRPPRLEHESEMKPTRKQMSRAS